MAQKVLLFGDIGIDDTMALLYAFYNDEIDIVGVVADYGNIPKAKAIANVRYVSSLLNVKVPAEVDIIGGAEIPMTGEIPEFFAEIHGEYGLGPIIPPVELQNDGMLENFYEIVEIINRYDDLIIVNTGRLTSLATMFILYPNLMNKIKAYYIMGGAFWVPGNITAVSEANFYGDPIAVRIVLTFAKNVTIIPLNVTQSAIATPQMVDYIDRVSEVKLVKPLLDYYYAYYKQRDSSVMGSPLHDVLTVMAPLHEEMLEFSTLPVHIVQASRGVERGQSIVDIRPYQDENQSAYTPKHRIAFQLNYHQFYIDFMSTMTGQRFN